MTNKALIPHYFSALFIASCVTGPNYNGYMQPVYVGPWYWPRHHNSSCYFMEQE